MAQTIGICAVVITPAEAIRTRMDRLPGERIYPQSENELSVIEAGDVG
jgi:hypothetical protein